MIPVGNLLLNHANTRSSYGLSQIVEFVRHRNPKSVFFCKICHHDLEYYNIQAHCTGLPHLFRFTKSRYPIEFERILSLEKLTEIIRVLRDVFLKKLSCTLGAMPLQQHHTVQVNDDRELSRILNSIKIQFPAVPLDEIDLDELEEINQREENDMINIMTDSRPKDSRHRSEFLQSLIPDDDEI